MQEGVKKRHGAFPSSRKKGPLRTQGLTVGKSLALDECPKLLRHFAGRYRRSTKHFTNGHILDAGKADGVSAERFLCCHGGITPFVLWFVLSVYLVGAFRVPATTHAEACGQTVQRRAFPPRKPQKDAMHNAPLL